MLRKILKFFLIIFFTLSIEFKIAKAVNPMTEPLIQKSDLKYLGAFRVPQGGIGNSWFGYNGMGMVFRAPNGSNGANGSLFITGSDQQQKVAEISIPQIVNSNNIADLNTATVLQPFTDPTNGNLAAINNVSKIDGCSNVLPIRSTNGPCGEDIKIGGLLIDGNNLIGTSYDYYDAGTPMYGYYSHWKSSLNLSAPNFQGMFKVDASGPSLSGNTQGFVAGQMTAIPSEWQSILGGTAITGLYSVPITSRESYGPAAFAFTPSQFSDINTPINSVPLLYYPQSHPNLGLWNGQWNPPSQAYNGSSMIYAVTFPNGTRSVLYMGIQGTGWYCYGAVATTNGAFDASKGMPGCEDPTATFNTATGWCSGGIAGNPNPVPKCVDPTATWSSTTGCTGGQTGDVTQYCYDPAMTDGKGPHSYPYSQWVWAYDANDLTAAKNGTKNPYDVLPYGVWKLTNLPFVNDPNNNAIMGATYDNITGKLYISQQYGDGVYPVIYAFQIKSGVNYLVSDFTTLISNWLHHGNGNVSDINIDNIVNSKDLGIMMSKWN